MTIDYKVADWIRFTLKIEPEKKEFIMDEYGLNGRAIDRIIGLETYLGPIKNRKKDSNVQGERCGRSKLKERDIKCIRFYYGILSNCEQAANYGVYPECIRKIGERLSWKHVK